MIVRFSIACKTCDAGHTLRIVVGHHEAQEHSFPCAHCGEVIRVAMDIDYGAITAVPRCVENCHEATEEGKIVNLHPDFPIPQGELHKDGVAPWLDDMRRITEKDSRTILPSSLSPLEKNGGASLIPIEWKSLRKAWSLSRRGKKKLSDRLFVGQEEKYGYQSPIESVDDWLFLFCAKSLGPHKRGLFENAVTDLNRARADFPAELARFQGHYSAKWRDVHLGRYFEVFRDYFSEYSEFSQTLLYQLREMEYPQEGAASSVAFNKTRMFYGNTFEALTSNMEFLACLNNILSNRAFEEFEHMSLKKYLKTDKAQRANPFKGRTNFSSFADCLDSRLRNASHHGGIRLDDDGQTVIYRSGGTGAEHRIPYLGYLGRCNDIQMGCMALLMLELLFANGAYSSGGVGEGDLPPESDSTFYIRGFPSGERTWHAYDTRPSRSSTSYAKRRLP